MNEREAFEAWWAEVADDATDEYWAWTAWQAALASQQKECKWDLRTRLVGDGCEVCNPELEAELAAQQKQEPIASDSYVHSVPDRCDRITWRGQYVHLPIADPPLDNEGLRLLRDAVDSAAQGDFVNLVGGMWRHQADLYLAGHPVDAEKRERATKLADELLKMADDVDCEAGLDVDPWASYLREAASLLKEAYGL